MAPSLQNFITVGETHCGGYLVEILLGVLFGNYATPNFDTHLTFICLMFLMASFVSFWTSLSQVCSASHLLLFASIPLPLPVPPPQGSKEFILLIPTCCLLLLTCCVLILLNKGHSELFYWSLCCNWSNHKLSQSLGLKPQFPLSWQNIIIAIQSHSLKRDRHNNLFITLYEEFIQRSTCKFPKRWIFNLNWLTSCWIYLSHINQYHDQTIRYVFFFTVMYIHV